MANIRFPQQELPAWTQHNHGEFLGDLVSTFNVDMSLKGKIYPSSTVKKAKDEDDDAQLTTPVAFVRTSADSTDRWWALCGSYLFKSSNNTTYTIFAQDAISDTPTALSYIYSDMIEFEDTLLVSGLTDIWRLTAGTWDATWWTSTIGGAALTTATPHPICNGFNNLVLIGNGNVIASVDKAGNFVDVRLTFRTEFEVSWIRSSSNQYWIGCRNKVNGEGKIYKWDGRSDNFNNEYDINGADTPMACVIKDDIPYVITNVGQLLRYTGGGFDEVAKLPIADRPKQMGVSNAGGWNDGNTIPRMVHRNGMTLLGGKINILLAAKVGANLALSLRYETFPSGIWELGDSGLTHRYTITRDNDDRGKLYLLEVGALVQTNRISRDFLVGAKLYKNNDDSINGIFYNIPSDGSPKTASIILTKIRTQDINQNITKLRIKFDKMFSSDDKIVFKYRTTEDKSTYSIQLTCIWTNGTTFTTSSSGKDNMEVGNEVTCYLGKGSGQIAHIVSITGTTTKTVVLDETIAGASSTETFVGIIRDWKKLESLASTTDYSSELSLPEAGASEWIQLKVYFISQGQESPLLESLTQETNKNR